MAHWTLYVRDGCNLCEEAVVLLNEMVGRDRYDRVDIGENDDLLARYAHRIPVLAIEGVDALEAPITAPDLRELLARVDSRR